MDAQTIIAIIEIALGVLKTSTAGTAVGSDAAIADGLVQIVAKAQAAYAAQVGQPMDPSLIAAVPID